jgi:2-keto-3-deoxy-L-fuconate dehydrogenase
LNSTDWAGTSAGVTGGASGIGRAIALRFAACHAHVCVLDINQQASQAVVDEIVQAGGHASAYACDITSPASVTAEFDKIFDQRQIGILVNSAGVSHIGTIETTSTEDFERLFAVNVRGTFLCMQACVPHMLQNSGGIILNLASIAATAGLPDRFAYSMTKGAVLSMTLSVARDYLARNIRCNCISPARVHTPFVDNFVKKNYPGREEETLASLAKAQPIGRMGTPEEIAALAVYLCSSDASFITGADIPIDGGYFNLRG